MKFFKICVAMVALFFSSWGGAAIGQAPPYFPPDSRATVILQCFRSSECNIPKSIVMIKSRPHFVVSIQTTKGKVSYLYPFGTQRLEIIWDMSENRHVLFIDTNADGVVDEVIDINTATNDEAVIGRSSGNPYLRAQTQYVELLRIAVQVLNLASHTEVKE